MRIASKNAAMADCKLYEIFVFGPHVAHLRGANPKHNIYSQYPGFSKIEIVNFRLKFNFVNRISFMIFPELRETYKIIFQSRFI